MTYHQITSEERYIISALKKEGLNQAAIARHLGRNRSSISRELRRNRSNDGTYRPSKAAKKAVARRSNSRRNLQFTVEQLARVNELLRKDWSPEQVSGHLLMEGDGFAISHETIYRHIWVDKQTGGDLYKHLRGAQKQRRKRYKSKDSRGKLAGKRPIADRPPVVEERRHIGHWEIDTVLGRGDTHCIVTIVERKTGYVLIGKMKAKTTAELNKRSILLIKQHLNVFKTITADNGTEFHAYKDIEETTGVRFFFATPYHSWERGSNENANGLIRQYLPKGQSMAKVTQHQCNSIAKMLNTRPRKRLGYKTPEACFYGI